MARRRSLGGALSWVLTHAVLLSGAALAASFSPQARAAVPQLVALHDAAVQGWALVAPGGAWHPTAFIEHKGHLFVEGLLVVVITALLLQGSTRPRSGGEEDPLTEKVGGAGGKTCGGVCGGEWGGVWGDVWGACRPARWSVTWWRQSGRNMRGAASVGEGCVRQRRRAGGTVPARRHRRGNAHRHTTDVLPVVDPINGMCTCRRSTCLPCPRVSFIASHATVHMHAQAQEVDEPCISHMPHARWLISPTHSHPLTTAGG